MTGRQIEKDPRDEQGTPLVEIRNRGKCRTGACDAVAARCPSQTRIDEGRGAQAHRNCRTLIRPTLAII